MSVAESAKGFIIVSEMLHSLEGTCAHISGLWKTYERSQTGAEATNENKSYRGS